MRKLLLTLVLCLHVLPLRAAGALPDEAEYGRMVQQVLDDYLRPGLADFEARSQALQQAVTGLCEAPSETKLEAARTAFAAAALAWAEVEYVDLHPWLEENRGARIYFFPDRRGVTARHLRRALKAADPALLQPQTIAQSSVALQGLPALEYLLYGKGFEVMAQPGVGDYRCRLAVAVAENLAGLAADIRVAWAPGSAYSDLLSDPQPHSDLVRSHQEAATLLLGRIATGLEGVRDRKVSPPLGASLKQAHPLRAAYDLSGLTNPALAANLEGLQALMVAGEVAAHLQDSDPATAQALVPAFAAVQARVAALPLPLGEAAADPVERVEVLDLKEALLALHRLAGEQALADLGLTVFFSADDGD